MGCNQPNLRVSGAEGTGRYQGTGSSHERRYARRFTAGRGGERARRSPGRGQFWLPRVVRRHTSERISTQKWRAVFSGRSGPRLIVQVVRFRFYFGASVLSCVLLAACAAMRGLVLYAQCGHTAPGRTQKWHTCPAMHKLGPDAHFPAKTIPLGCKSYSQLAGLGGQHAGLHCKC